VASESEIHLTVDTIEKDCCVVVGLHGQLDLASVALVRDSTVGAGAQNGVRHLIFDCEELDFMDSTGVKTLLEAHHSFDGQIALVRPQRVVTRVLEITGLGEYFNVSSSVEDAQTVLHGA
jgi:anti-sigma B factor antagonist